MLSFVTVAAAFSVLLPAVTASPIQAALAYQPRCLYLPSDAQWPSRTTWAHLNQTVGGRLIGGVPFGQPCHEPHLDREKCHQIQKEWLLLQPYTDDPVNVMSPYWSNNTCSPFDNRQGSCLQGNLASYAINVTSVQDVVAGIRFARNNNIRLTIKNSGSDFLGRSSGAGSLALWVHNLKHVAFDDNYTSVAYTGPAVRIGAGINYAELSPLASARGYRVVCGASPSVAIAGGYSQGGGHGALASQYGLSADQILEWEVVTAAGKHMTIAADDPKHADLFWALAGGGGGNYAVVLSATIRIHRDGPLAGAGLSFTNQGNDQAYWAAISDWMEHLLEVDRLGGITSVFAISAESFDLQFMVMPDVNSTGPIRATLAPFLAKLASRNVSLTTNSYKTDVHPGFAAYFDHWVPQTLTSNVTLGGRLIPRAAVRDKASRSAVVGAFRDIVRGGALILSIANNVAHSPGVTGSGYGSGGRSRNAVLPGWRNALFTSAFAQPLAQDASWDTIRSNQAQLNIWQEQLRKATPGAGAYINEATWDNPHWKEDYFGSNYKKLLAIKTKYDPQHVFWVNTAVGSDVYWKATHYNRLCRVE